MPRRERIRRKCAQAKRPAGMPVDEEPGVSLAAGRAHGRLLERRHEESAQERGGILADAPLAEVDEQDLALVHHLPQIQRRARLTEDIAQERVADELADFVVDWGHRLGLQLGW